MNCCLIAEAPPLSDRSGRLKAFGRLKTETFYARDWLSTSIEEFVAALDAHIRWCNEVQIKSSPDRRSSRNLPLKLSSATFRRACRGR